MTEVIQTALHRGSSSVWSPRTTKLEQLLLSRVHMVLEQDVLR